MTRKKGRSKGGGPGGDHGMEDDDVSTDEDLPLGSIDQSIEKDNCHAQMHDKAQPSSPRCPHVGKAVNVPAIKKTLKAAWIPMGRCGVCTKERRMANQAPPPGKKGQVKGSTKSIGPNAKGKPGTTNVSTTIVIDPNIPTTVWLCLRCGVQSCRPKVTSSKDTKAGHALAHFKVPRSDLHCICVNVTPLPTPESEEDQSRWDIFCFECNSNLYLDSYKKLHEAVEFVKRLSETKSAAAPVNSKTPSKGSSAVVKKGEVANTSTGSGGNANASTLDGEITKSRGLVNLGNTCFFNSVMQGLTQTHPFTLLFLARKYCHKGAPFETPSVQLDSTPQSNDESQIKSEKAEKKNILDSMTLALEEAGNMTLSYASFLSDMANITAKGTVNPSQLFGQICTRSPQFRGFQQQDAHELLRHLMEGLRLEEVKRQRKAILKFFGLNEKSDPKAVQGDTKRKLQALKQHSNYTIIDKIFGGHLVSTVVCESCHNSSQNYEPFLDLSLPLIEERDHPPTSKQKQNSKKGKHVQTEESQGNEATQVSSNFIEKDEKKSKHQMKKEKEKSRKEKRKNKKNKKGNTESLEEPTEEQTAKEEPTATEPEKIEETSTKDENAQDSNNPKETCNDIKVTVESASDGKDDENDITTNPDSAAGRLQLRTTSRTPLSSDKGEKSRSRSCSPSISERMKSLSREATPVANEINDSGGNSNSQSRKVKLPILSSKITKNLEKFQKADSSKPSKNEAKGGSEEDDEGDAYLDDDEEWEWEYDEPQKETKEEENSDDAVDGSAPGSDDDVGDKDITPERPKLVSLNPLPPERLIPSDLEKSSVELGDADNQHPEDSEATTGASSNADVEDNVDVDVGITSVCASTTSNAASIMRRLYSVESSTAEWASTTTSLLDKPFRPDPDHLDPHMEQLCKNIRKLSVTTSSFQDNSLLVNNTNIEEDQKDVAEGADADMSATNSSAYQTATAGAINTNSPLERSASTGPPNLNGNNNIIEDKTLEQELLQIQLQNEWVTRSLTSIAPRYRTKPGECSVYSCLTQFTAPELLTGNNKWACGRCTKLKKEERRARQDSTNKVLRNEYASDASTENNENHSKNSSIAGEKNEIVYSNASKQLLVFCPPAVLTIHVKRFQQTMTGLRKISKHVQFPISLDLGPFCSSTSMAMENVPSGVKEIKYYLFGVVEHSGSLRGGHYTAYVNTRASQVSQYNKSTDNIDYYNKFYSSPNTKTDHIDALLKIIEVKSKVWQKQQTNENSATKLENPSDMKSAAAATAFGENEDACTNENSETKLENPSDMKSAAAATAFGENEDACKINDNSKKTTNSDKADFVPNGKWYYISDAHVTEVAQEKVLKCQAYILLYERVK